MHPETMTSTFIVSPTPESRMSSGTSTGGGVARKNSSTGSSVARTRACRPMTTPRPIPTSAATT